MEYFNGKIGRGRAEAVVGMFGLGVSNKREDRLIQFCRDSELKVLNITQTKFRPGNRPNDPLGNQFKDICLPAKIYPETDVSSDHNLLVTQRKVNLKTCCNKRSVSGGQLK